MTGARDKDRLSRMRLSVALCSCNGARWLGAQLQSLASQTRLPDELIVCDDASSDASAEMVAGFARKAPFAVQLVRREQPLGASSNFADCLEHCSGELVALCDQDDVWLPRKLELLERLLEEEPDAGMAFCDAELVDSDLNPLRQRLREVLGPTPQELARLRQGDGLGVLVRHNVVSGATMMIRWGRYRELLRPIPKLWLHDAWCALVLAAVSKVAVSEEALVAYRQHELQQIGARRNSLLAQIRTARRMHSAYFGDDLLRWEAAEQRLGAHATWLRSEETLQVVHQRVEHARRRVEMRQPSGKAWSVVLKEWRCGNYDRFALGWKSALQDIFLR